MCEKESEFVEALSLYIRNNSNDVVRVVEELQDSIDYSKLSKMKLMDLKDAVENFYNRVKHEYIIR